MIKQEKEFILAMHGISKSFPGVKALDEVDLKVRKGTVHVIAGENGAGKSTLMKILSGEYRVDEGEIYFNGKLTHITDVKTSLELGIAMIYQELSPVLNMTIAENIFLGREPEMRFKAFVDYRRMYGRAKDILESLNLSFDPRTKMSELSIASIQLIEIAKAISRGASLIIMDEPTSAISQHEVEMLFKQINDLRKRNTSIIYITHKMDEIFRIADDITVIRDGKHIESGRADSFNQEKIISLMVGRTISNFFPKEEVPIGETVLEVKNLTTAGVFSDISFSVKKGEILGLSGLVGAGRTEVVRAVFGLDPYESGEIIIEGKSVKIKNPAQAIRYGICMVSEDRKEVGLVLNRSVRENISLANLQMFTHGLFLQQKTELDAVKQMVNKLRIKTPSVNQKVLNLSGGNQQKIVLAKWLLGEIKILILDEPTRGIDVGAKAEIHKLITDLAKNGVAIVMISSELPEILGMSDRIVVLQQGRKKGELSRKEATQEKIMTLATGAMK